MKFNVIIAGLFFLIASAIFSAITFDLIWGKPDKISAEWQSQSIFLAVGFFIAVSSLFLSYGVFYAKRWSLFLYSIVLSLWYIFLIYALISTSLKALTATLFEAIASLLFFVGIPLSIEVFLIKSLKTKRHKGHTF